MYRRGVILIADDDLDFQLIVQCALEEIGFRGLLQAVRDGAELMDHLQHRGKYKCATTPDLIILDLKTKDGRSALREIKADPSLRLIPVAVMTDSNSRRDMELCSRFRKCSCTRKPGNYEEWTRNLDDILRANLPSWDPAATAVDEKADHCSSTE